MFSIIKQLRPFSAAHRLIGDYVGRCAHLHGHNYLVLVRLSSTTLTSAGFVMDFDQVKRHLDEWVQVHWDHATLVSVEDISLRKFLEEEKQKHYVIPARNTSSEILAQYLLQTFEQRVQDMVTENAVQVVEVQVCESSASIGAYQKMASPLYLG